MKLSNIVIEYRKRMQISQREFARRCDLSNSYISFIENEHNPRTGKPIVPTLEQYKKIASGMGLTVHQLFEQLDEDCPVDLSGLPDRDAMLNDFIKSFNKLSPAGKDYLLQQVRIARMMFNENATEFNHKE